MVVVSILSHLLVQLLTVEGYDTSFRWTFDDLFEPERTYVFQAYDWGTSQFFNSTPIYLHARPVVGRRGRWVARQF